MRKLSILGLICLFILICCKSPADPEIGKVLEPPAPILGPTIVYFTATNPDRDRYATLSWEVLNATRVPGYVTGVSIYHGGHFALENAPLIGMVDVEVCDEAAHEVPETQTFRLEARNDEGLTTASVEVEPEAAIVEFTLIPERPIFTYSRGRWISYFTVVFTETNGIGSNATLSSLFIVRYTDAWGSWTRSQYDIPDFGPFGTVERLVGVTASSELWNPPTQLRVHIEVWDSNEYFTRTYAETVRVIIEGN